MSAPTKTCRSCGRTMTWRKAWARSWDEVCYCSAACRRRGRRDVDVALGGAVRTLRARRPPTGTICPSEAARTVGGDDWETLMEPARAAARRLVADGEVEITQRGRVVDPSTARGPIRIRAAR